MTNISTQYLGMKLKSPIIAGSCGLTSDLKNLREIEKKGAGAIILKSLFEEEIRNEMEKEMAKMNKGNFLYPETMDYYDTYDTEDTLTKYLKLLNDAKKELSIPIIPSINCVTADKWPYFAKTLQDSGADALELNIFMLPSDFNRTAEEQEQVYFKIIEEIQKQVTIPISLKISHYHSNLASFIKKLSETSIHGLVLFNRYYSPDFDIENFKVTSSSVLSSPGELSLSLRWISIMSNRINCSLAASTGIHDDNALIKQILAGADVVQVASTMYKHGFSRISEMISGLQAWMDKHKYEKLEDFQGKMSQERSNNPAAYERVQFMKYFGEYDHV